MAFPWYSSEFPLSNLESKPALTARKHLWSIDSVKDIIVKSNNVFKLPERDIDKISELDEEKGGDQENLYHTGLINRAFLPMRVTLMFLGRWPFTMKLKNVTSRKTHRNTFNLEHVNHQYRNTKRYFSTRVKYYISSLRSPLWIYFGLTTLYIFFVLVMSTLGFLDFFLDWQVLPGCSWKTLQSNIFHDNLVMFLLVWGCLLHGTVCSFSFFLNRKKIAKTMNYWNVAVDELGIDEVNSHRRFLIASNLGYVMFLVMIYFAYSTWRIALVRDGAALFGTLALRPLFFGHEVKESEVWKLQLFGIATMIYAIYASRAFLFLFCFKCRLLKSLFRVWNSRLIRFLRRPENEPNENRGTRDMLEKLESERLLSNMTILLQLVKQTDKMFATILQAYYAVQLLNMCFELYMLAKSGTEEFTRSDNDSRGLYILTAILTFCQNIYFFFTVSLDGAYVGEEAAKGLEALRSNAICPHMSVYRKYLVYNLGTIYNQRIALTGGKFFVIDRPFIITVSSTVIKVLGAVLTYFIIILQVGPSLQQQTG